MTIPSRPNVLWLMTDEQRCDSLGCYGSPWAVTPTLDALAGEGVRFEEAITPSPVCVPARVSLLTGRYPCATGVYCNEQRPRSEERFLTTVFAEHGYQTASFGKQHYNRADRAFETQVNRMIGDAVGYFDYLKGRDIGDYNVVRYAGNPYHWIFAGRFPEEPDQTPEAQNVCDALGWCYRLDRNRPYLLRISFNAPHTPVVAPSPFDTVIDPATIRICGPQKLPDGAPRWEREGLQPIQSAALLGPAELARMRQCYYGLVAYVDRQIGDLLDGMRRLGLLENTIVVFVSDHGTLLGDYGMVQKQCFYRPVLNVPFFFVWPGHIPAHRVVSEPVETISLLPTLLELCHLPIPPVVQAPGLAPVLLTDATPARVPVFSEIDLASWKYRPNERLITIRDGRWRMTVYRQSQAPAGSPVDDGSLYDLARDPYETCNLYREREYHGTVQDLLRRVEQRDAHLCGAR